MNVIVIGNKNGFTYRSGDTAILKRKIEILITDDKLRQSFGKRSSEIICKYSHTQIIKNVISIK